MGTAALGDPLLPSAAMATLTEPDAPATETAPLSRASLSRPRRPMAIGLLVGAALVVAARLWGQSVYWANPDSVIRGAPFFGRWDVEWRWWTMAALAVGLVVAVAGSDIAARLRWGRLLVATWLTGLAWAVALAASDGLSRLAAPADIDLEYLAGVPAVGSIGDFLDTYIDQLPELPLHARSHPPGMIVLLWVVDRLGLSGPGWAAALEIGVGASAAVAVLVTLRALGAEDAARRAAPFLAVAPMAVWSATTADALFAGLIAWGTALIALAVVSDRPTRGLAGGAVLAASLYFSYGAVLLLPIAAAIVVSRRAWRVAVAATVAALVVTVVVSSAGFWWFDGLDAARGFYESSSAQHRPYWYSLVGNLGAFVLVVGPAAVAGLAILVTDRRRWPALTVVVGAVLVGVVAADLSGMSKAEIERIWLPFAPWVVAAAAAIPLRWHRPFLASGVVVGVVLETWLDGPW